MTFRALVGHGAHGRRAPRTRGKRRFAARNRSGRFPGEQRVFHRFSDLTNEVLKARIWAGIHFRNPDVQAANLGREVVNYVRTHQFAFVH